jgi:aldehyde:ferredoxin oxidoreductase
MTQIRQDLGDGSIEVTGIGPAGEKLVRYACLVGMGSRAHGRTGMGAVMGSKRLKAIAVRGGQAPSVAVADEDAVKRIAEWGSAHLGDVAELSRYGTARLVGPLSEASSLPSRNYTQGTFEGADLLEGERLAETILKQRATCFSCGVACKRVVEVSKRVRPEYGGPEYQTIASLGSYCGIADLAAVSEGNQICNALGMDTISAGASIAWAMECYEQGLLGPADVDGLDLRFGHTDAMLAALRAIGRREGRLGDLLAEGSARAATKVGGRSKDFLTTVKGQEVPAHMPQAKRSLALIYAVNPFGADHMSSEHDGAYAGQAGEKRRRRLEHLGLLDVHESHALTADKVRFAYYTELLYSFFDSACMCHFVWGLAGTLYGPEEACDLVQAVTGWNVSLFELMKVGERRLNLMRFINARAGARRKDDQLPKRLFEPLKGTRASAHTLVQQDIDQAIDLYYQMAGWDSDGIPLRGKLAELGLEWLLGIV